MRDFLFARRRILFFLVLVLGSLALRWPALDRKVWNLDEGSTVTMAEMILDGRIPFKDAADNRTPLVPYLKAAVLWVAGDWNVRAIHITVALMLGLTAVLLWQTGRRLGREPAGVFAAISFFWLNAGLIPPVDGMTAHTGWFLIFFSALGFWIFADALTRQSRWAAFASGLAFGFSYLAKQPGLLDFGVGLVIVGLATARQDPAGAWRLVPPLVLGFLLPLAGTIAYFASHGALDDLIFYSWTYNTKYYVPEVPERERLAAIRIPFLLLAERMPLALGLTVLAWAGLLWTAVRRLWRQPPLAAFEWLVLGWSATGLLSTVISGREFSHYSIQVLPGVSLAGGWLLAAIAQRAAAWRLAGQQARTFVASVVVTSAILSFALPTVYWIATVDKSDENNPAIGRVIQERSRPEDLLFVWGYMPEIHVFAQRLPSTRFFYTNWVTGLIPWTNVDWFTDTRYAIIPGTPEQLRADFDRRPPTIILDTDGLRGYLKYPIREQAWLWKKIVYEFAEVDPDIVNQWGFHLYQRIADAPYGARFPAGVPVEPALVLTLPAQAAVADTPARLHYPAGTTSVELYKDGELYRRLTCPPGRAGTVIFTVAGTDLPVGRRIFQAIAHGAHELASAPVELTVDPSFAHGPLGPPLEFEGRPLLPLVAVNREGELGPPLDGNGLWGADAPARIVYERPPGLYGLEVEYKLADLLGATPEKWWTDGLDFAIEFAPRTGPKQLLVRRHLDARYNPNDRGLQTAKVLLPLNEPGRVTVWFSPGAKSDASSDWAWIKSVRGIGAPLSVRFNGQPLSATRIETPLGLAPFEEEGAHVLMVHAPSTVELPFHDGMHRLTGVLGLLPAAWTGPKGSAGAIFEVWHVPPTGEPQKLHSQLVDPVHNETHRGPQPFSVPLPLPATGFLRLVTRPAHPEDNAFNYTYWGELVAKRFPAALETPDGPIPYSEIEAHFGYDDLTEAGQTVTFVHAPSHLVFPLSRSYARLRGEIGLTAAAYTGGEYTDGARFIVEHEDASGHRTVLWQRDLDPRANAADRGFIPFTVDLPAGGAPGRLVLRTDARAGHGYTRAWTFWHGLRLEP